MEITKQQSLALRGVAVILLLMHHLFAFPEQFSSMEDVLYIARIAEIPVERFIGIFGKICVAMFLFLSGYGVAIKENLSYAYIVGKLKGLFACYWVTFAIFVSIGIFFLGDKSGFIFDPLKIIFDLTGVTHYYNATMWFLSVYIACLVLAPLLVKLHLVTLSLLAVVSLFLSHHALAKAYELGGSHEDFYLILIGCLYYLFPFIAGIVFRKGLLRIISKRIFYIGSCVIFLAIMYENYQNMTLQVAVTPFFIIVLLPLVSTPFIVNAFAFLGKQSLGVWLTHTYFYYYFFSEEIYSLRHSVLIFIVVLALSLVASYFVSFILKTIKTMTYLHNLA